jgi:NitT/TauT family transport system substrate-binding protein
MRQPQRSRLAALIGVLVLFASAMTGCGESDSSGGGALEKDTITVVTLPVVDCAPIYIAQKQNLFEAEGLDVRVKLISQSTASIPALAKGEVDITCGNYVSFLQAQEKGTFKLSIVGEAAILTSNYVSVLTGPDSPIRTAKDLEGKTVAVNLLHNIQTLTLDAILKANGADPAKVRYVAVPFPQMGAALEKGQVDAVSSVEPFVSDIRRKLRARVAVNGGGAPVTNTPLSGYLSTQDFTSKNPKTAAAFQRALFKAQQAAADRKRVEEVVPTYARIQPDVAAVITLPGYPASLSTARIQRVVDLMTTGGLLKQKPDLSTLLFRPSA